jgi:hypothetical protein
LHRTLEAEGIELVLAWSGGAVGAPVDASGEVGVWSEAAEFRGESEAWAVA